jgi:4-hydroxy-tetrahydrodipicolinate reductase
MLRVGVFGAAGKMGQEVCKAVFESPDLELVAAIDPAGYGMTTAGGLEIADSVDAVARAGADVAVDFTHPDAVVDNALFCLEHGIHVVIGTTGLTDESLERLSAACGNANAFVAPNFSIGAVLMMHLATKAAPFFDRVEIVEAHHDQKADAPSGTAIRTAQLLSKARPDGWPSRGDSTETVEAARGATVDGIRVHAIRLPGVVADQAVIFGTGGQTLAISHRTIDRTSFMPGVLAAIREVPKLAGLTVGLERLLGLE